MAATKEGDRLSGRIRRYAKVSTAVGGLAARLAGQRVFGAALDHPRHAADLRRVLGGLKGPLMKVAQILSTIPEALPREYSAELAQLQANAPSMGWPFVRRRMASELGADWQTRFRTFEPAAAAAASLGQVHRAVGLDGAALACKLQYPDMSSAVAADIRQLKLVFAVYRRYDRSIDTTHVLAEIAARLREELDYELEARHMQLYGEMLKREDGIRVPHLVPELSTRRLLSMTWLDGEPLMRFTSADLEVRNRLARLLFHAWYVPFYRYGVIHADPHLGNYTVGEELSINLLDFGCVRSFEPRFVHGVIDLYTSLMTGDQALAVHAYETWGFGNLSKEVIETLNLWAEFVYAPLLEDRARRIQEFGSGGLYGVEVAEKVHRRLRELGGVTPPPEFVFMDRAAIGLGGVFLHLKAEINWHRMFLALIDGFEVVKLRRRQVRTFKEAGVPLP